MATVNEGIAAALHVLFYSSKSCDADSMRVMSLSLERKVGVSSKHVLPIQRPAALLLLSIATPPPLAMCA